MDDKDKNDNAQKLPSQEDIELLLAQLNDQVDKIGFFLKKNDSLGQN